MSARIDNWSKGRATVYLLLIMGSYGYIGFLIPKFESVFDSFDTKLPFITQLVFDTYLYWFVFVALGMAGYILVLLRNDRRGWYILNAALVSAMIIIPVTVWAMYAPVLA